MKYTKEERLNIGRRIYDGEISRCQAAEEYDRQTIFIYFFAKVLRFLIMRSWTESSGVSTMRYRLKFQIIGHGRDLEQP